MKATRGQVETILRQAQDEGVGLAAIPRQLFPSPHEDSPGCHPGKSRRDLSGTYSSTRKKRGEMGPGSSLRCGRDDNERAVVRGERPRSTRGLPPSSRGFAAIHFPRFAGAEFSPLSQPAWRPLPPPTRSLCDRANKERSGSQAIPAGGSGPKGRRGQRPQAEKSVSPGNIPHPWRTRPPLHKTCATGAICRDNRRATGGSRNASP
jgi:hypothetical protein